MVGVKAAEVTAEDLRRVSEFRMRMRVAIEHGSRCAACVSLGMQGIESIPPAACPMSGNARSQVSHCRGTPVGGRNALGLLVYHARHSQEMTTIGQSRNPERAWAV